MKKIFLICALFAGVMACAAQATSDNFEVGPYVVDYYGNGDVRYRMRDGVDLYEFFELQKDTVMVAPVKSDPVGHGIAISLRAAANRFSSKDFAIEGEWKQRIGSNLYFNGGLSLGLAHTVWEYDHALKRNMFELGIPLQIEWSRLDRIRASLYGLVGIVPTFYSTINAQDWDKDAGKMVDGLKKSGFLIAPALEIGGNIPVGPVLLRIGVYGMYKFNCTKGDFDVYANGGAGKGFFGAKIGIVL